VHQGVTSRDLKSPFQVLADVVVIVALACCVGVPFWEGGDFAAVSLSGSVRVGFALAVITLLIDHSTASSSIPGLTTRSGRFRQAVKVWTFAFGAFLFFEFVFSSSSDVSHVYLISCYLTGFVAFAAWRAFAAPAVADIGRKFGAPSNSFVVLGDVSRPGVRQFVDSLQTADNQMVLVPLKGVGAETEWSVEAQHLVLEASLALREAKGAACYVCSAGLPPAWLEKLCRGLSVLPVATYIVPDLATAGIIRCRAFPVGNRVAFELRRAPLGRIAQFTKSVVDISLGALALVLLSPVMLAALIAIKLDSKGPVLFHQTRTGKDGVPFRIYKFRTMDVLEDGPTILQACRDDPRVTRVGRWLRASSVDELPQLFNVLRGEMSLVGPRPHAVAHDQLYSKQIPNYVLRQHVKPGITGWAQVNGYRGETSSLELMQRRVDLDIWYAQNVSVLLDLEILVRTVFEVCRPRNAY
jgi:undecaprenyl-phosphate galactose phosphotransferase/putative colanic acid biosynthesis UDP-glucose lipid carrier transferase